jgi:hypothetical protein
VSGPRLVRREAVVSLDTSRAPAMLLDVGNEGGYPLHTEGLHRHALEWPFPKSGTRTKKHRQTRQGLPRTFQRF